MIEYLILETEEESFECINKLKDKGVHMLIDFPIVFGKQTTQELFYLVLVMEDYRFLLEEKYIAQLLTSIPEDMQPLVSQ
jgi:hypothetical protein